MKIKIKDFDDVSKFRLINAFIFAVALNLIIPIVVTLKGQYLLPWVISILMIIEMLSVKTNSYFTKFKLDSLYKLGILVHLIFTLSAVLYFFEEVYMVYVISAVTILEGMIFSAYSIKLNTYLAENHVVKMNDFQIKRNSIWADGTILGLSLSTGLTFFFDIKTALIVFLIYNVCYMIWMGINFNFYKERGL